MLIASARISACYTRPTTPRRETLAALQAIGGRCPALDPEAEEITQVVGGGVEQGVEQLAVEAPVEVNVLGRERGRAGGGRVRSRP